MPFSRRKQTAILSKRKRHLYNVFKNSRRIGGVLTGDDTQSKLELAYHTMLGLGVNRTELLTLLNKIDSKFVAPGQTARCENAYKTMNDVGANPKDVVNLLRTSCPEFEKKHRTAVTLQAIRRGNTVRSANRRKTRAAIKIQSTMRKSMNRIRLRKYTFELLKNGFRSFGETRSARTCGLETLKDMYLIFRQNHSKHIIEELDNTKIQALNPNKFMNQLIDTTVVVSKPTWFNINSRMYMAEIWLLDKSKNDDLQDIGTFVHVIPNLSENESWNWKNGEQPWTYHVLCKGDEHEYVLCSDSVDTTPKKIDKLNDNDEYYITPKTKRTHSMSMSKLGHQLRLSYLKAPWQTQDAYRTSQADESYFVTTVTAKDLLAKCFIDDDLSGRMAKERNNDLPNAMKEHLNKKSVTIEVQSAQDENMEECEKNKFESRFIVIHVYVVVNDGELPSNPDTPWKVTGITLRNTQSVFS